MSADQVNDGVTDQTRTEIDNRYEKTSKIRDRAIELLAEDEQLLRITLADKESSRNLIKLLDGQDKQTIARQKNTTDEKAIGASSADAKLIASEIVAAMGGFTGMRGEPDQGAAPSKPIDLDVNMVPGEMSKGPDETLTCEALLNRDG